MSVSEAVAPPKKRSFLRLWLPFLIIGFALLTLAVMRFGPFGDWEAANRNVSMMFTTIIASGLLLIWFILFSGLRWYLRLAVVLVVVLVGYGAGASVRKVTFSGDMFPTMEFFWDPTHEKLLEQHRREASDAKALSPIRLDEGKPEEIPEFRGRKRDGVVTGPSLQRDWRSRPPRLLWRQPVGGGYSGFAVAGNVAVTLEQRGPEEVVVCYDTATGRERWRYPYPAHFAETLGGEGPRSTPTLSQGDVFSLGATGVLVCLNGNTGAPKWSVNILEGNDNIIWGMAGSPLVYDKLVVVNPGVQTKSLSDKALVAYDRSTGKPVWSAGNRRAGYSSPMLATIADKREILLFDGEGLGGFDAKTGKELWQFKWDETMNGINVAEPIVLDGDRVFISSGYGIGCALVQVSRSGDQWSAKEIWKNKAMRCRFSNPVLYKGDIYGLDEGFLACLDPKTGKRKWRGGRYGHGQLLLSGDLLVILSETGQLALVEAKPEAYREVASFPAIEGKTWNYLALMDGKAFVRNHLEMACYDLTGPAVQ
jgi:outer membrane protein assembly factor BamB